MSLTPEDLLRLNDLAEEIKKAAMMPARKPDNLSDMAQVLKDCPQKDVQVWGTALEDAYEFRNLAHRKSKIEAVRTRILGRISMYQEAS